MSETHGLAPAWATVCQNCGATLGGPFCAQCGQRAVPPHPTIRELAGSAWDELIGWDGKLLRTIRLLVLRPGELTRAAIEGQRARYISPVRLYLACSVLYFVVAASVPLPDEPLTFDVGVGVGSSDQTPSDAVFEQAMRRGWDGLSTQERAIVEAEIAAQPSMVRPLLRALVRDAAGLQRRVNEILPRALFVLIPALAAILAVFYRRRNYPEHLYAALHLQTFVFLAATIVSAAGYTQALPIIGAANVIAAGFIVGHAVIAQRRVYQDSWAITTVKAVCVAAVYGALWTATSFAVAVWASQT